jgi:hypothetical protein
MGRCRATKLIPRRAVQRFNEILDRDFPAFGDRTPRDHLRQHRSRSDRRPAAHRVILRGRDSPALSLQANERITIDHDRDAIAERGRVVSVKTGKFGDIRVSGTNDGEIIASPIIQASFHNIF